MTFLKKIANLPPLPGDLILCTIDAVQPFLNIPHEEGLIAITKALDTRKDQTTLTDPLIELAECALKNNIFEHDNFIFKQLRGTTVELKWRHLMLSYLWTPYKKKY